jgi:hypothetical protein
VPRGGSRPGAGRKRKPVEEQQAANRDVFLAVVTAKRWRAAVFGLLAKAAEGDALAFRALAPYVMGAAPKELTIRVDVAERIREAARAAGIDPQDALDEAERILAQTKGA